MTGLEAEFTLADRGIDLRLAVPRGQVLALVGPNGSGKSSTLSVLCGLLRPDRGVVRLGERLLLARDAPGLPGTCLAPHQRRVALLAQRPALFPHLDARANVAFGLRAAGMARTAAARAAEAELARVGAGELAGRRPGQLSGGQAQRVALARALAPDPELLLLDEPLAALDVTVAANLRPVLRDRLAGRTAILVTHELIDVMLLADVVAVIEAGRLVELGPPAQVLSAPRTRFAAELAGLNLLPGVMGAPNELRHGLLGPVLGIPRAGVTTGAAAVAVFRPAAVAVHLSDPSPGSPRNHFPGVVASMEPRGDLVRVVTPTLRADITPAAAAELRLAPGTPVTLSVKAAEVDLYPA